MKTSLTLDARLVQAARKEAEKSGKTLSETITLWARLGWELLQKQQRTPRTHQLKTVDLGGPAMIDLHCRRDWLDTLDS